MSGRDLILMVVMVAGLIVAAVGLVSWNSKGVSAGDVQKGIALAGTVAGIFAVVFTFYKLV